MKKNLKSLLSFTLAALIFSAGCAFFSDNPLLMFIDVLSILSLVLLVVGLVEFLIHGGYFDFLSYSFSSAREPVDAPSRNAAAAVFRLRAETESTAERQRTLRVKAGRPASDVEYFINDLL